tara:strand:+ start:13381 stop:14670 length:1290 start_codon:yes stop_codon:yes gene_type:complete
MSKLRKEREKKEKRKMTNWEKVQALFWRIVNNIIKVAVYILLGIVCVVHARFSQTKLLPDCLGAKPYTQTEVLPEQIHLDFIPVTIKNAPYSVKAMYPVKSTAEKMTNNFIFNSIKSLTSDPNSGPAANYIGIVLKSMVYNFYNFFDMMFVFINGTCPEWLLMVFSPMVLYVTFFVTGIWCMVQGLYTMFTQLHMIYAKKVDSEDGKTVTFVENGGLFSVIDIGRTITSIVLIIVLCVCFGGVVGVLGMIVFGIGIMVLVTPVLMNKYYSSTDDINSALAKIKQELAGDTAELSAQQGGGPDDDDGGETGENGEKSSNDEEKEDGDDASDEDKSGGGYKPFLFSHHAVKFLKLYKHWIMIYLSIMLVFDIYEFFGSYPTGAIIFSIIIAYWITSIYTPYDIKKIKNFSTEHLGTNVAKKDCPPPPKPKT